MILDLGKMLLFGALSGASLAQGVMTIEMARSQRHSFRPYVGTRIIGCALLLGAIVLFRFA